MPDYFPIDKIFRMQDWQSGYAIKRTCCEIVVFAYSNDIGVAIVGINDGIGICSISIVRVPYLGNIFLRI